MDYGLNLENQNLIIKKAKEKKDGIFQFRGVAYRVVSGRARLLACRGEIIEFCFGFNMLIGKYEDRYSEDKIKALKNITINDIA